MLYSESMIRRDTDPDFGVPRGLEAYVPDLVSLRSAIWPALSEAVQLLLEVADYVGLERALGLFPDEVDGLYGLLPGELWGRAAAIGTSDPSAVRAFRPPDGPRWCRRQLIAELASAFSRSI
jgi:hypothetical protein